MDGQWKRGGLRRSANPAGEVIPPHLRRKLQIAATAFLFWSVIGVFFASQLRFAGLRWGLALAYSLPRWYSWGLLTPGVVRVDRWIGRNRSLAARVAWHIPLGVGWTCLAIAIRLVTRPLRGSPPTYSVVNFFLDRFYWDLLIYGVIAGFSISRDYAMQVGKQERQAAELAIETAELERSLTEARLQALRAQIHPHFLFNTLNMISAFTETDPAMARRLMERLGDLLRASLTLGSRPMVVLGTELTFLEDYLAIEAARFEGRIVVTVDANQNALSTMVPSFLLQPLVENAIRHGVGSRLSGGRVEVTAVQNGPRLVLRVLDNGVGLRPGWDFAQDAGIGLKNIASRLEYLYGMSDLFCVTRLESGGVEARIDIPLAPLSEAEQKRSARVD